MDQFSRNRNMPVFQLTEKIEIRNIQHNKENNYAEPKQSVMKHGQKCILETENLMGNI